MDKLSRRQALRVATGVAVALSAPAAAVAETGSLRSLVANLRIAVAARNARSDSAADEAEYMRHHLEVCSLREVIERTPAFKIEDIRLKGVAAQMAFDDDPEVDCTGPGSFPAISRSILRDLLSI